MQAARERLLNAEKERKRREEQAEAQRFKENAERQRKIHEEMMWKQREEVWNREKASQEREADESMKELAVERRKLRAEKEKLLREGKIYQDQDGKFQKRMEKKRQEVEQEVKEAENNLEGAKRRAEESAKQREARDNLRQIEEEKERLEALRRAEELKATEEKWKEQEESLNATKRNQVAEVARLSKQMVNDAKLARARHEADIRIMREETDKMEREMLAKLEMVRKAKREGLPVDLSQLQLGGSLSIIEPIVSTADEIGRRGSERSLGATNGSAVHTPFPEVDIHQIASSPSTPSPPPQPRSQTAPRKQHPFEDAAAAGSQKTLSPPLCCSPALSHSGQPSPVGSVSSSSLSRVCIDTSYLTIGLG